MAKDRKEPVRPSRRYFGPLQLEPVPDLFAARVSVIDFESLREQLFRKVFESMMLSPYLLGKEPKPTMSDDEQALIAAVLADPADDTPRLVFADWLEENGEPDRAEFIRDCCRVLARHTDCPTRLADLKAGRPVPLRCGVCDYCLARRRAERFYARTPWLAGLNYAVCFEPTPLDGTLPTGPGITLVVTRGFVSRITLPAAAFTADLARAVWSSQPVTAVTLTGARPYHNGRGRAWFYAGRLWPSEDVPAEAELPWHLFDRLDGWVEKHCGTRWKAYESEELALSSLSAAVVRYGRATAGTTTPSGG